MLADRQRDRQTDRQTDVLITILPHRCHGRSNKITAGFVAEICNDVE